MNRLLLLVLSICLLAGCTSPQAIQYKGLQITDVLPLSDGKVKLVAAVTLYNPNAYEVQIWQADAVCTIKNQPAGIATLDTLITLPALQNITVPLAAKIETKELFSNALQLALGGGIDYKIQGSAKASKGGFKWKFPFTLSGKLTPSDLKGLF